MDRARRRPPAEQRRTLLDLVCANAASVLGHTDPGRIDIEAGFLDLGLDSLTALELRDRLAKATGLPLPATVVFDNPTPSVLAAHLHAELVGGDGPAAPPETGAYAPAPALPRFEAVDVAERIGMATVEEIFEFIDRDLGRAADASLSGRTS